MKLLFKQRVFSWFDSYDIYNEQGDVVYFVKGQLSIGHKLLICNQYDEEIAEVREDIFTFLPKFRMLERGEEVGLIEKEFSFLKPKFHITCNDWIIQGDVFEWEYEVTSEQEGFIMHASKEVLHWSDTYVLDIADERNALRALMVVLAIDAAKCSKGT